MKIVEGMLKQVENKDVVNGTVVIPGNVNSIGELAFLGCTDLEYIEIPPNVKRLESGVFFGCYNLNEVSVCKGTYIGEFTMAGSRAQIKYSEIKRDSLSNKIAKAKKKMKENGCENKMNYIKSSDERV